MIFHLKSKAIAFETLQISAKFQIVNFLLNSKAILFLEFIGKWHKFEA